MLEIGYAIKPHALKGHLKSVIYSDYNDAVFSLKKVYVNGGAYDIEDIKKHGGFYLIKFKGINSADEAAALKSSAIEAAEMPPHKRGYYLADFLGEEILNQDGLCAGKITGINFNTPVPVYTAEKDGNEFIIPAEGVFDEQKLREKKIALKEDYGL